MQRDSSEKSGRTVFRGRVLAALVTALAAGCGADEAAAPAPAAAAKPFAGASVAVRCADAKLAAVLRPMVRSWAVRTGATAELTAAPFAPGDAADLGVLPYTELGAWADRGELATIPTAMRETGHPLQWSAIVPGLKSEPYAGWGAKLYGLPIAGDGHVLVYRADRFADPPAAAAFQAKYGRPLAPPATWEDLADAAAFFAERDKAPSLPPPPADPARLADLFFRVAAGFDRPVLKDTGKAGEATRIGDALAFAFTSDTAAPRLDQPGFRAAAEWLASLKARGCVPPGPADPVALLKDGKAVLAVLSLEEVARLRPAGGAIDPRLGVAAVPGTRGYAEAGGRVAAVPGNYIPYFGGGWLGAVRAKAPHPAAAFDLLADLAGPTRSAEVVAATGYGPTRLTHLDRDRLIAWLGYGFDADRSRALQDAVESYVARTVRNPAFGLRSPDHAALTAALGAELRAVADGVKSPAAALAAAAAAWEAAAPTARERERRRRAVGLD